MDQKINLRHGPLRDVACAGLLQNGNVDAAMRRSLTMQAMERQIFHYGIISFKAGNYIAATDYFATVVDFSQHWTSRWYLAQCYLKTGRAASARHELAFIAERCPDYDLRDEARILLKQVLASESSENTQKPLPEWLELLRAQLTEHTRTADPATNAA